MINQFKIYTSYFAKVMHHPDIRSGILDPISISNTQPNGFNLYKDLLLCPYIFLTAGMKTGKISESVFRHTYLTMLEERLKNNPADTINTLYRNTVLVCWEAPDKFCHRRIFADWYLEKTGYEIPELLFDSSQQNLFAPTEEP